MRTRVVILAAGAGQRFNKAGYTVPKPLIPVLGKPMLQHVLERVYSVDPAPLVVCSRVHAASFRALQCCAVPVEQTQRGAALSLLCAGAYLWDEQPVLVCACDDIVDSVAFYDFTQECCIGISNETTLMTMMLFDGEERSSRWAYVLGNNGHVSSVSEKRANGSRVYCGTALFRSWAIARLAICRMIAASEDTVEGEFYVAPTANYISKVRYVDIPRSAFSTVGTPAELQSYERAEVLRSKP